MHESFYGCIDTSVSVCVCVSVYMSMNLRVYECLHCVCMYMSKDMNENMHGNMQTYTIT